MSGLATGGAVWVCVALSDLDREVASAAPDHRIDLAGHDEAGAVAMLPIDPAVLDAAYNAIANTTLWFLHHHMTERPQTYDAAWREHWASYVTYNTAFADAVVTAAAPDARVLVQDYHLALLPAMVRDRRPDLRIAHFTHTPWASVETFATLPPEVAREVLVGMLGADSAGFHSPRWAADFVDCCTTILGAEPAGDRVSFAGHATAIHVHALGVDPAPLLARASGSDVTERRNALEEAVGDRAVIARVDRTEPSKNIARGLEAYAELLRKHPEHHGHVVHVALAYPSRQDVAEYRDYTERVTGLAAAINDELGTGDWRPVLLAVVDDYPRSLATLQLADVFLINPVRDGMNLVAKEGALLTEDAVLVLSTEAGAADELGPFALLVDPFDVAATAAALHDALTMPAEERVRRHTGLTRAATALSPHEWLQQQLDALGG
jgi:trehalose 6-phosphate synthase